MDTITISFSTTDLDEIIKLINRKIEKLEAKEPDEFQVAEVKKWKSIKSEIEVQIS